VGAKGAQSLPRAFSKIVIKSDSATFRKDQSDTSQFLLQYKSNVSVTFSDGTVIAADLLDAFLDEGIVRRTESDIPQDGIRKIIFTKNVLIKRQKQSIRADTAEIIIGEKLCKLCGNIKIEDLGDKEKKIPFCTLCNRAQFEWESEEIKLFGSADEPVNTVIKLEDRLKKRTLEKRALAKKLKEQKRQERR
jgi:lipopolysaccharide export system protein LptA